MMGAGRLNRRLRFEKRASVPAGDDLGSYEGGWEAQFTVAAGIKSLRGGESVIGARLTGTQPVIITVRMSSQTRAIGSDWQAVDAVSGEVFALTSPPADTAGTRMYLNIMATSGVAS